MCFFKLIYHGKPFLGNKPLDDDPSEQFTHGSGYWLRIYDPNFRQKDVFLVLLTVFMLIIIFNLILFFILFSFFHQE